VVILEGSYSWFVHDLLTEKECLACNKVLCD